MLESLKKRLHGRLASPTHLELYGELHGRSTSILVLRVDLVRPAESRLDIHIHPRHSYRTHRHPKKFVNLTPEIRRKTGLGLRGVASSPYRCPAYPDRVVPNRVGVDRDTIDEDCRGLQAD